MAMAYVYTVGQNIHYNLHDFRRRPDNFVGTDRPRKVPVLERYIRETALGAKIPFLPVLPVAKGK
jgi:hypothetical protein